MTIGVLTHGDGITMLLSSGFVLDRPLFEATAFTPYAVFDPEAFEVFEQCIPNLRDQGSTRHRVRKDAYLLAERTMPADAFGAMFCHSTGFAESSAESFRRKEQRAAMLFRLTEGYETGDGEYIAQRNAGPGPSATEVWRLSDLHWGASSATYRPQDLPAYLMFKFPIDRRRAWLSSWVLVRSAYVERDDLCDSVIAGLKAMPSDSRGKRAELRQNALALFDETLRSHISELRRAVLK